MVNIFPFHALQFSEEVFHNVSFLEKLTIKDHTHKKERVSEIIPLIKTLLESNKLQKSTKPIFCVLKIQQEKNIFIGLIAVADIDRSFKEHEKLHLEKKEAYYEMAKNEGLQINPILGIYRGNSLLQKKLLQIIANQKSQSFKNGSQIYEWTLIDKISDIEEIQKLVLDIKTVFIGDGHHRLHVMQSIYKDQQPEAMFLLVNEDNITFKSCHRLLFGEISFDNPTFLSTFEVKKHENLESAPKDHLTIIYNDQIYELIPKFAPSEDIHSRWPHVIFDEKVIPFLGHIESFSAIGGNIKYEEIFDSIKNNYAQGAVLMPSLPIPDFFDLVSNNFILPASSTWFEPKIMEGFISMSLSEFLKN